jgi:hypothetical protein
MGKPNERDRSYYSALGKYISATITQFPAKRKIPQHQNYPKICLDFCARKIRTTVRICPFQHLKIHAKISVVRTATELPPSPTENAKMDASKSLQQATSISMPS